MYVDQHHIWDKELGSEEALYLYGRLYWACRGLRIKTVGDLSSRGNMVALWRARSVGIVTWGAAVRLLEGQGVTFLDAVQHGAFDTRYGQDLYHWQKKWERASAISSRVSTS